MTVPRCPTCGVPRNTATPNQPTVSEDDRELLYLLANGASDDAAARKLDISKRTVRRRISALAKLLGVSGRFALGVAVGQFAITALDLGSTILEHQQARRRPADSPAKPCSQPPHGAACRCATSPRPMTRCISRPHPRRPVTSPSAGDSSPAQVTQPAPTENPASAVDLGLRDERVGSNTRFGRCSSMRA